MHTICSWNSFAADSLLAHGSDDLARKGKLRVTTTKVALSLNNELASMQSHVWLH